MQNLRVAAGIAQAALPSSLMQPGEPEQGSHEDLRQATGPRLWIEQFIDVRQFQPQFAMIIQGQVEGQRPCQHDAIDAAGGGPGDDIHQHPQPHAAANLLQQLEVDLLGVQFAAMPALFLVARTGRLVRGQRMVGARRAHQLEDFPGNAVHVDREGDTAIAHQGEAQFPFRDRTGCAVVGHGGCSLHQWRNGPRIVQEQPSWCT